MRQHRVFIIGMLIYLLVGGAAGYSYSAPARVSYLPVVYGREMSINEEPIKVLDCSCGDATAEVAPDGRIYVMVQDFDQGGRLYVYVDDGVTFEPSVIVPLVGVGVHDPAPSFQVPGQKHGPGGMVFLHDRLIIYAPARPAGVLEGDYDLYKWSVPLSELP